MNQGGGRGFVSFVVSKVCHNSIGECGWFVIQEVVLGVLPRRKTFLCLNGLLCFVVYSYTLCKTCCLDLNIRYSHFYLSLTSKIVNLTMACV